jgi:hypothetical protein
MFNRQLSLLAIATLLLSPNLVHATEIDGDRNLAVGNIRIINTSNGTLIQTPNIQVNTPTTTEQPVFISRIRRRTRIPSVRRIPTTTNTTTIQRTTRTSAPLIFNNKINSTQTTVTTTTSPVPNTTVPTPPTTVRSSTIRTSSGDENSSQSSSQSSTSEQQQSVQCSGGSGTVVSQSSSTVNGRTVNSEVRRNCN